MPTFHHQRHASTPSCCKASVTLRAAPPPAPFGGALPSKLLEHLRVKRDNELVCAFCFSCLDDKPSPQSFVFAVQTQHSAVNTAAERRFSINGFAANSVFHMLYTTAQTAATKAAGRFEGVLSDVCVFLSCYKKNIKLLT